MKQTVINRPSSMGADRLLSSLQKVRASGPDRWSACCPAHDDRSPSLSVKLADDGRVLVHCFAGCTAREVVEAVGMRMGDLFREKGFDHQVFMRSQKAKKEAERAVLDALIVRIAQNDVAAGKTLSEGHHREVREAMNRLQEVANV